jgi:hypothetical protein
MRLLPFVVHSSLFEKMLSISYISLRRTIYAKKQSIKSFHLEEERRIT